MKTLAQSREERLDREIDAMIAAKLKKMNLATPISPHARVKLREILKKYARSVHPFRDCVRDNMKRFGPGRTEAVCGTLKASLKGIGRKVAASEATGLDDLVIDADVLLALDAISDIDLQEIFLEARALDEHGTVEATALMSVTGASELQRWGGGVEAIQLADVDLDTLDAKKRNQLKPDDFALPPDGYPMHDLAHARNALSRAAQHATPAEQATIKKRVYARWPQLKPGGSSS